jgi:hypothetical protein
MGTDLGNDRLATLLREVIGELQEEPEFQSSKERIKHALDENGQPDVKVAVANVPLDYDLWDGLRNPAVVGSYPAGLREIWEYRANRRKATVDESGRSTIFQVPQAFDFALSNYNRAVLASVMLPFSPDLVRDYAGIIQEKREGSSHVFSRMYDDVNRMIDTAISRVAMDLMTRHNVVVAMDNDTVRSVSAEALPLTQQGTSHGPCKGGNFPQKSLAVLLGLGQFGVCRIVIRDEAAATGVERFVGPLRSIIIFDKSDLITDGEAGVFYPGQAWRDFLLRLSDFTDTDPQINRYRSCTYVPYDEQGCTECLQSCPTGAQAMSVPTPEGRYSSQIANQQHRFWEGKLQFDFGRCLDERSQMATMFPEWSCARCLTSCAAQGKRRASTVADYQQEMRELNVQGSD